MIVYAKLQEVEVPLSEHEQNVLAQMERDLFADDPHFATRISDPAQGGRRRRIALGALGVLVGLLVVVFGVVQQLIWLGAVGFAVMVLAGLYAFSRPRHWRHTTGSNAPGSTRHTGRRVARGRRGGPADSGRSAAPGAHVSTGRRGTFMQRMEIRWERRRSSGGW